MKTTNSKSPVKKIQESVQVNQHQSEMAVYFENRITAADLIKWITTVTQTERVSPCGEIDDFISNIGWSFLPAFIECQDKKERIEFLQTALINVFSNCGYEGSKSALSAIGINYLSEFSKISADRDHVTEFMSILTNFLCLTDLYGDYIFFKSKAEKKAQENNEEAA